MITAIINAETGQLLRYEPDAHRDYTPIDPAIKTLAILRGASVNLALTGPRSNYLHTSGGSDVLCDFGSVEHWQHVLVQEACGDIFIRNGRINLTSDDDEHDALGFSFTTPGNIVLQDLELIGVKGSQAGDHGDGAQCYTTMKRWYLLRVLMTSEYQGLFIANDGANGRGCDGAYLNDCQFIDLAGAGKMLWLGNHGFAEQYASFKEPLVHLHNVQVQPFGTRSLRDCVHPGPGDTWNGIDIGVRTDDDWQTAYWPPESGISGIVTRI